MPHNQDSPPGNPSSPRHGRRACFIVLGPPTAAALATALGAEADVLAPLWLAAIGWTALASLVGALLRGFRHGDWSAFRGHRLPGDSGELDEWASRTGRYAWLGEMEERLRDGGRLL